MRFMRIAKIEKDDPDKVYHLTVEKNHNFFANNLCVHNCDYRGEIGIIIRNDGDEPYTVKRGDRMAQLVLTKVSKVEEWEVVEDLDDTNRGTGGFGSTGTR